MAKDICNKCGLEQAEHVCEICNLEFCGNCSDELGGYCDQCNSELLNYAIDLTLTNIYREERCGVLNKVTTETHRKEGIKMNLNEVKKSSDMIIGLEKNKKEENTLGIQVLKSRKGDYKGRRISNYLKQAKEADGFNMNLIDIKSRLEEEIPGVKVSNMFGEVIIEVPKDTSIKEVQLAMNKVIEEREQ